MNGTRLLALAAAALAASGLLAVSGVAGTDGAGGDPAPAAFRLADGSAGCAYDDGRLTCSTLDDPGAAAWAAAARVVLAGESWWHGGYACRVSDEAIRCSARSGPSLLVDR